MAMFNFRNKSPEEILQELAGTQIWIQLYLSDSSRVPYWVNIIDIVNVPEVIVDEEHSQAYEVEIPKLHAYASQVERLEDALDSPRYTWLEVYKLATHGSYYYDLDQVKIVRPLEILATEELFAPR